MLRSAAAAMLLAACPVMAHAGGLRPADGDTPADAPAADALTNAPAAPAPETATDIARTDPWENQNRKFFKWNESLDAKVVRPSALGYQKHTPSPVRRALRNFLTNLSEPVVFANDVLQLHFTRAAVTAFRFCANSTVGIAGIFDVAAADGAEHHNNGFGTTMGHYGVPPGPYVFLPVLGPSTVRDMAGDVVDGFADPFTWARLENRIFFSAGKTLAGGLDTRASADTDLQALNDTATDPYASLRSAYLQHRQAEIEGELGSKDRALPDFDDTPVASPAPAPSPTDGTAPTPDPKDGQPKAADQPKDPPSEPQATATGTVAPMLPIAISYHWVGNPALESAGFQATRLSQQRSGE